MDTYETVCCRLCGKHFKQFSTSHASRHDITVAEYREKFPTAPIMSQMLRDNKSKNMKKFCEDDEVKKSYSSRAKNFWNNKDNHARMRNSFKQRPKQSNEVVEQISQTMKQRYAEGSKLKLLNESDNMRNRTNPLTNLGRCGTSSSTEIFADNILKPYGFLHNYTVPCIESNKGYFYIDFALPEIKLAIELDSEIHSKDFVIERDSRKTNGLQNLGWTLFRINFNSRSARRFTKVQEELLGIIKMLNLEIINED